MMPALVLAFAAVAALVVGSGYSALLRDRLQARADASALAAAGSLLSDDLFSGDPRVMIGLAADGREAAARFAEINPVVGGPPVPGRGDALAFGTLEGPRGRSFRPSDVATPADGPSLLLVDSARVVARLGPGEGGLFGATPGGAGPRGIAAGATATLDRDLIGVRPVGHRPAPLAPLAILSDPSARHPWSWQSQVDHRGPGGDDQHAGGGRDLHRFRRPSGPFEDGGGDGIPEVRVCLARNAALLRIGEDGAGGACRQLLDGVSAADLAGSGGELSLRPPRLAWPTLPAGSLSPDDPDAASALGAIAARGEPRAWAIAEGVGGESTELVGFVAARVVRVEPGHEGSAACLLLQPCMMALPSAVTDPSRRGEGRAYLPNPYLAKVRLVD